MIKSARLLPLVMLLTLSCCTTLPASATLTNTPAISAQPNRACEVFKPIIYSRLHDTTETIEQVKAHNAAYDALCGAR